VETGQERHVAAALMSDAADSRKGWTMACADLLDFRAETIRKWIAPLRLMRRGGWQTSCCCSDV
jgi:hypothetical protein